MVVFVVVWMCTYLLLYRSTELGVCVPAGIVYIGNRCGLCEGGILGGMGVRHGRRHGRREEAVRHERHDTALVQVRWCVSDLSVCMSVYLPPAMICTPVRIAHLPPSHRAQSILLTLSNNHHQPNASPYCPTRPPIPSPSPIRPLDFLLPSPLSPTPKAAMSFLSLSLPSHLGPTTHPSSLAKQTAKHGIRLGLASLVLK